MNGSINRLLGAALAALLLGSPALGEERVLADFAGQDELRWRTVNDNVMGGKSQGDFQTTDRGTLLFSGTTSLRNNGGFSSIRTRRQPLDLKGYDGLEVRVRGDGRTYKVALRTSRATRWISYWAELPTVAGEWQVTRIPFDAWVPTSFGRKLRGPALSVASINSVGFMIYDKQAGEFSLEVDRIAAYRGPATPQVQSIVETATGAGAFGTLLTAAKAAGLVEALQGPGPITLFAPTDDAFAALPADQLAALLKPENRDQLRTILTYHVVPGSVALTDMLRARSLDTLSGQRVPVAAEGGSFRIGGAIVTSADLACTNGMIHVVDRVMMPELDSLAEVATKAGAFQTLLAAAKAAGLAEALANGGPFTVFAPTDEAFAALPAGTVEALLRPGQRDTLVRILKHHLVSGTVFADQAVRAGAAETLAGTNVELAYAEGRLQVAGAAIAAADVPARNGVIHVIDRVLLPPDTALPKTLIAPPGALRIIEDAVREGVPLFNGGDQPACRTIYETAVRSLLDRGVEDLFSERVEARLRESLTRPKHDRRAVRHAWKLRHALDAARHHLRSTNAIGVAR